MCSPLGRSMARISVTAPAPVLLAAARLAASLLAVILLAASLLPASLLPASLSAASLLVATVPVAVASDTVSFDTIFGCTSSQAWAAAVNAIALKAAASICRIFIFLLPLPVSG